MTDFVVEKDPNNDYVVTMWYVKPLVKNNADQSKAQQLVSLLMQIDGFDGVLNATRYSMTFLVAKTFDVDEVVSEIQSVIRRATTDITIVNG